MVRKLAPQTLVERENQILDLAHSIVLASGSAALTMEKIAEQVPFSKGTLYNHFKSREDVLMALFCRIQESVYDIFRRGASYSGSSRDRYSAVITAAEVRDWSDSGCCPTFLSPDVLEKASTEYHERFTALHHKILGFLNDIAADAIKSGDLPVNTPIEELNYSTWALAVGADELHQQKMIYGDHSADEFAVIRRRMLHRMLDGYGWKALSTERDYEALHQDVLDKIFPQEWEQYRNQKSSEA